MSARIRILGVTFASALLGGAGAPAAEPQRPPNLVLITLDTTRADHLGAWGHTEARTPRLDALAGGGVRFERCDTAAPITLPSHATILSGLFPPRHGVRDNGTFSLRPEVETVAERLAAAGFDTAAVVSAVVLARRHGLDQGFRIYDDDLGAGYAQGTEVAERDAHAATETALALLARLHEPYFLWVHYFDAHEEYRPPSRFAEAATGPNRLYDGEIAYVDEELGRLLDRLPERTAVVVVGDHGEMLGEHGEATHGLLLNAGVRRVPLILAGEGVPRGTSVDCLVRTADVAPTLLELAAIEPGAGLDGRSLLSAIGSKPCDRISYTESFLPFFAYRWYPLRSISDGRAFYLQAPEPSLYRLDLDPAESVDLAERESAVAAVWRARLEKLLEGAGETVEPDLAAGDALSEEQLRQLASLGYLGGGGGGRVGPDLPDPRARLDVARELHEAAAKVQEGRCAQVLEALLELARREPRNFPALTLAGECLRDAGRRENSVALFRRAAAENERSPVPPANLGALYVELGRRADAERELRRALVLDPAESISAARLARLLREAGRGTEAIDLLDRVQQAGGHAAPLFLERGTALAESGRLEEALADFLEAARRDAGDPVALENAGKAAFALGRVREAAIHYETLARRNPGRADLWKTLGSLAMELGERERALESYRAALRAEIDPAEREAIERLIEELAR